MTVVHNIREKYKQCGYLDDPSEFSPGYLYSGEEDAVKHQEIDKISIDLERGLLRV